MTIEQAEICVDLNGSAYDRVYGEAVTAAEIELPTVNGASVTPHGPSSSTAEMWQRSFGAIGGDAFTLTVSGWNDNSVGTHDLNTEISFTSGEKTNYRFRFTNGSYTVSKAPITIETASEEKTYDGVPLPETAAAPTIIGTFYDPVTVSNGVGIITDAGEEINRPVIHWEDPADANNYDITENYGTLIIHSLPVEIDLGGYNYESDDGSFPYDGEFHGPNVWPSCNDEGFEVNKGSDTDWTIVWSDRGDTIHIHVEGGGKDVGTYTFTYTVSVSPGKSGNYNISFTGETLTISSLTIEETPSIVEG